MEEIALRNNLANAMRRVGPRLGGNACVICVKHKDSSQ